MKTYRIEWKRFEFSEIALLSKEKHTPTKEDDFKCIELEHIDRDTGNINGYKNAEEVISTKNVFYKGDILFGKLRPYLRKFAKPKFNGLCSSEIWVLKNTDKSTSNFLFYLIQTNRFIDIVSTTSGTRMPRADWKLISKAIFPVPPIGEQERIAEVLLCWDKAIEENLKIISLKEKRKKALMQSLLSGKFRLKGFSAPWKTIKFGEVFERVDRKNNINNENVLTISAQNGFISQGDFFNKSVAGKNLEKYLLLKKGEFGYNRSYSKGYPMGAIKRLELYEMGVVSTLYICFSAQKINPIFASHYFESGVFNKEIYKIAQEGARNHGLLNVALGDFFKSCLFIPTSLTEQEKIAEILSVADEGISLHKAKVELLKKQKKYLMQVLLSGKVRLASS